MEGLALFESHYWYPFAALGLTHSFFRVDSATIMYTWVVLVLLLCGAFLARYCLLWYPRSVVSFCLLTVVKSLRTLILQSCREAPLRYVSFFGSLFLFLLCCNCLVIFPGAEEPTRDINTTFALGFIAFFFVQAEMLIHHGLIPYLNDFFKTPVRVRGVYNRLTVCTLFGYTVRVIGNIIIGLALLPLELLSKLSGVMSLSCRLFGNILASSLIGSLWLYAHSGSLIFEIVSLPLNLLITLFFGVFDGVVQAIVFMMLSLSWLGRSIGDQ